MIPQTVPFPAPEPSDVPTVRELIDLYLQLDGPELAPQGFRQRSGILREFGKRFGSFHWTKIRKSDVKAWVRDYPSWKSDETKRNVVRAVKRVFSWAESDERIGRNPLRGLNWQEGKPRRSMTADEFRAFVRAAPAIFRRPLIFLLETGCRPQECCRLEWPMIEWDARVAVLPEHKTAKKTGKPRILYLSPLVVRLLRWLERQRKLFPDFATEHVFFNAHGLPWRSQAMSARIAAMRKDLGIPGSCKLYGLRHGFGNRSQAAGNDIRTTADLMGHSSTRTTEKYYLHAEERRRSLLAAVERANRGQK